MFFAKIQEPPEHGFNYCSYTSPSCARGRQHVEMQTKALKFLFDTFLRDVFLRDAFLHDAFVHDVFLREASSRDTF